MPEWPWMVLFFAACFALMRWVSLASVCQPEWRIPACESRREKTSPTVTPGSRSKRGPKVMKAARKDNWK